MIEVKEITAQETYNIRQEILRKNIDLPVQFSGDFDANTFHLGVYEDAILVGISSFMKTSNAAFDSEQYQLRGMATIVNARGKGYGRLMLNKAFEILKERGVNLMWCNAREVALDFYVKQGFHMKGKPFDIKGIGIHLVLFKKV